MHEQLTQNSKYLPFSSGFVCRKCIFAVVLVDQRAIYVVSKDSYACRLVPHPLLNTWYLFETRHSFLAQCNLPPHLNETGIIFEGTLICIYVTRYRRWDICKKVVFGTV